MYARTYGVTSQKTMYKWYCVLHSHILVSFSPSRNNLWNNVFQQWWMSYWIRGFGLAPNGYNTVCALMLSILIQIFSLPKTLQDNTSATSGMFCKSENLIFFACERSTKNQFTHKTSMLQPFSISLYTLRVFKLSHITSLYAPYWVNFTVIRT